ncbi:sensor histidine kinase [Allomuricauda sp. M10]|uniref:sensor histidine kinase n=1 Tax=Allomuricauda sp. M10 TaxID=2683292 RepID=UPI001D18F55A|nr:HAMP domain-containing sensor histidine kinase [Muricauda sp. M10]
MHPLLKRQLNKYLPENWQENPSMTGFLEAVNKSYGNYDEKLEMLQRATTISSEELYEANRDLEKETKRQAQILESLENALEVLQSNFEEKDLPKISDKDFNAEKMAIHIGDLATEVSQMTYEKDRLLRHLETQNESLNNYAHIVSHDLKSPIRNIGALISWIKEDEGKNLSGKSQEHFNLILQNLEKMDKLINGILQHATLGNANGTLECFDLAGMLLDIQRTIYVPQNITFEYSEGLPTICFDRYKIEQLFMNLMTNAVKATENNEKGKVKISGLDKEDYWYFTVSDNGKGIPEKHRTEIFEMFNKLENDGTATGIGLALVKKIVGLYEGNIWLESREGEGTTFHFTLKKQRT